MSNKNKTLLAYSFTRFFALYEYSLSDSVSINVPSTTSVVSSFSSRSCLLYLRPQRCACLSVSLAEIFSEADSKLFAYGGIFGHLSQRVPV